MTQSRTFKRPSEVPISSHSFIRLQHLERPPSTRRREGSVESEEIVVTKNKVGRRPVFAHVFHRSRLRDGDHPVAAKHPGKRDLRRGDAMPHRNAGEALVADEPALRLLTPSGGRVPMRDSGRTDISDRWKPEARS